MISLVDIEGTVLVLLLVLIVSFSTFFGFIGTSSSANDTNVTNITNTSKVTMASSAVTASADPTPSASGISPSVSISVSSPVDLGNVIADGSTYNYIGVTQVNASASEITYIWNSNDDDLNLYVKASGDLTSPSDNIPLSNLQYDGFSNSSLSRTHFTTDYNQVKSWNFQSTGSFLIWESWGVSASVNANYYLTVPTGIAGESYTTMIYYLAIIQ